MKLLVSLFLGLMFSVTSFAKSAKDDQVGEFQVAKITFSWNANKDPLNHALVRATCADKKQFQEFNLSLNRQEPFSLVCSNKTKAKGVITLIDETKATGIFLDAYIGDDQGPDFDMHFEGLIAMWEVNVTPPAPPTPPVDRGSWGMQFDLKKAEDFRNTFK